MRLWRLLGQEPIGGLAMNARFFQAAEVSVNLRKIAMREDETWSHPQSNFKGLHRTVVPATTGEDGSELKVRLWKIVPQPHRHQGVFDSWFNLILPRQGHTQSVMRVGGIRINLQGSPKHPLRFSPPPLAQIEPTEIGLGGRIVRSDFLRRSESLGTRLQVVLCPGQHSSQDESLRAIRFEAFQGSQARRGFHGPLGGETCLPEDAPIARLVRVAVRKGRENGLRFQKSPAFTKRNGRVEVGLGLGQGDRADRIVTGRRDVAQLHQLLQSGLRGRGVVFTGVRGKSAIFTRRSLPTKARE